MAPQTDIAKEALHLRLVGRAVFMSAQVCSACVMSFAHGANDVANAMGPFAAIYAIWQSSAIPSKSNVPEWILVVGEALSSARFCFLLRCA